MSWIIREVNSGKVVMETFDKRTTEIINTERYEVVPILKYLQEFNRNLREEEQS